MAYQCTQEERRLQRMLIPLNIVVCVLCAIAIVSLFCAPLIRIDFGMMISAVYDLAEGAAPESEGTTEESNVNKEAVLDALKNVDVKLTFTLVDFGEAAFSKEDKFDALIKTLFGKDIIEEIIVPAITSTVASVLRGGTNAILHEANEALKDLGGVQSEEEFSEKSEIFLTEIENAAGEQFDAAERELIKNDMLEAYRKTIEVSEGEYDLEKFACTAIGNSLGFETPVTDYDGLVKQLLQSGSDGVNMEQYSDVIGRYMIVVFCVLASFPLVWFVLFLFALLRIFAPNKRFMMWYVKLFGATPAIIFYLAPKLVTLFIKEQAGSTVAGILAAYSSLAWISGLCYIALWLVSICWAFPIKHKIRKLRKQRN